MEIAVIVVAVGLLVAVGSFVIWVWTLVDVLKVPSDDRFRIGTQMVWVLVIVFTQIIGSIIYLVLGRPEPSLRR